MPNDVVTRAIDAVCAGDHLTADHASAVLAEIMEGRADPVQTGAFLIALRAKGETVPELVGLARTMRSLATPVATDARRPRRHRRHRRRALDLQRLDHRGAGRRRRRLRGRQARQPLQHQQVRLRRPAGGARRRTSSSTPSRSARCIDEVGFGFMFAPRHHAAMAHVDPGPQGARGADDLQLPRAADQPGRGQPAAARRLRPPLPGDDRRGAGRPRQRAGAGRRRRGRPRRALDLRPDAGDRGRRRRAPRSGSSSPASSASPPAELERRRRRHPGGERRRDPRRARRASRARAATSSLLNAAAAIYVGGLAADLERGRREGRRRRSTPARQPTCWSG